MKLYLHIGSEKTGTSSIQAVFGNNRSELEKHGILYPRSLGKTNHLAMLTCFQSPAVFDEIRHLYGVTNAAQLNIHRAKTLRNFQLELETHKPDTVVISSEHLSSRLLHDQDIALLKDYLAPLFSEITVIFYVRRQDELLESTYLSDINFGVSNQRFTIPVKESRKHFYLFETAERWAKGFGSDNIIVRAYNRKNRANIIEDFLSITQINCKLNQTQSQQNVSMAPDSAAYTALLGKHIPGHVEHEKNWQYPKLVSCIKSIQPQASAKTALSLDTYMEQFHEGNQQLASKYLPDSPDILNYPYSSKIDEIHFTEEDHTRITADLWEQQQQEVDQLALENVLLKAQLLQTQNKWQDAYRTLSAYQRQNKNSQYWNLLAHSAQKTQRHAQAKSAQFKAVATRPAKHKLTIVTISRGNLEQLQKTLPHCIQSDIENIVVDWSCPQHSGDWVEKHCPNVKVLKVQHQSQLHEAKAKNLGISHANGQFILITDPTLLIQAGLLSALDQLDENTLYTRIPTQSLMQKKDGSPTQHTWHKKDGCADQDNWVARNLILFSKKALSQVPGYDNSLTDPLCAELDFRLQLILAGYAQLNIPSDYIHSQYSVENAKAPSTSIDAYLQAQFGPDFQSLLTPFFEPNPKYLDDNSHLT